MKTNKMSALGAILRNKIAWYLISRYMILAIQFLASILIAERLGSYLYGIWSFIILLVSIGGSCNWGIGNAVSILYVQNKEDEAICQNYIYNGIILVLLSIVPLVLLTAYDRIVGIGILEKYQVGNLVYAVAWLIMMQYVCNFFINVYRVKNKILEVAIQQSLWPILMFATVLMFYGKVLFYSLLLAYIVAMTVPAILFIYPKNMKVTGKYQWKNVKKIFTKGFYLFLYNTGFALIVLSTKILISHYYTVEEFGYFSFSFTLAQGVMFLIDCIIFLLFPKMTDMLKGNDVKKNRMAIKELRQNYILPLHLLFYIIIAVSPYIFTLFGKFSNCYIPLVVILFTMLMYSHCFGYNSYLLAQDMEKQSAYLVGIAFILNIVIIYCLIHYAKVSYEYVIFGTLVTYYLYSVAVNCYALYRIGEHNWKIYVKENLSLKLLLFYTITIVFITTMNNSYIFSGIICALFIIMHLPQIMGIIKNIFKVINNDKLLDI